MLPIKNAYNLVNTHTKLILWTLFLSSLCIRLFFVFSFYNTPYFDFTLNANGPDQNRFGLWAESIKQGSYVWEGLSPGKPFDFAPLYPTLMAISLFIPKHPFLVLLGLQALLSSTLVFIFYDFGKQCQQKSAGILAAVLWSLFGVSYYYDACLIRTSLITSLTLMSIWSLMRALNQKKHIDWIITGLFIGVLCAIRPNILFFVIPLWITIKAIQLKSIKHIGYALIVIITAFIVISPITIRNYMVSNQWVPVAKQGADSLILGNDPTGPGVSFIPTPASKAMKRASKNDFYKTLQIITEAMQRHPKAMFELYLRKLRMFFNDYEIPSNYSFYIYQHFLPTSKFLFVTFAWIIPLAVIGFFRNLIRKDASKAPCFFFVSLFISIILIHLLSRYRFPITPLLIYFAAFAIVHFIRDIKNMKWIKLVAQVPIIVFIAITAQPLPSYGYHTVTNSSGVTDYVTNPIRRSDYITTLLAYSLVDTKKYAKEIEELGREAFKTYGYNFIQLYDMQAKKLTYFIEDTLREEYIQKHNLPRLSVPEEAII